MKRNHRNVVFAILVALMGASLGAQAAPAGQELVLQFDAARTDAAIMLEGNLHSVEGSFEFKRGSIHFSPASGAASGEVVFDATSGKTGNASRDRKMHKDVLASQSFPEISFSPDHAEGTFADSGESTLQVHGLFLIHGTDHEITVPVQVNVQGNSWSAEASFTIPYTKWGMKNPSVFFFRVGDTVRVHLRATGNLTR